MFKNNIDYWMDKQGLKNKHIAKACEVTETTFSKWRQNKTQPDLRQSAIIARKLGVSIDDLANLEED